MCVCVCVCVCARRDIIFFLQDTKPSHKIILKMGYSVHGVCKVEQFLPYFVCVTFDPLGGVGQRSYCTNKEGGAGNETDMFSPCRTWAVGR